MSKKCPYCQEAGRMVQTNDIGTVEVEIYECTNLDCRVNTYKYNPMDSETRVFSRHKHDCDEWDSGHTRCQT